MYEIEIYYTEFAKVPARWADKDPAKCGCRGFGVFVSEVDTLHECPLHKADEQDDKEAAA